MDCQSKCENTTIKLLEENTGRHPSDLGVGRFLKQDIKCINTENKIPIYIYIYVCIYIHIYIHTHIYI